MLILRNKKKLFIIIFANSRAE